MPATNCIGSPALLSRLRHRSFRYFDVPDASGPAAADVSTWEPDAAAIEKIRALNKKDIDGTANHGTVNIVAGGKLLLVGAKPRTTAG
jgi:hypothetical protein